MGIWWPMNRLQKLSKMDVLAALDALARGMLGQSRRFTERSTATVNPEAL